MPEDKSRLIDLDLALASKYKKVPRLLAALIKKLVRQKSLNKLILKTEGEGVDFCTQMLEAMGVQLELEGLENVPNDGTLYTFVSNHPLGGVDGVALCSIIGRKFGNVKTLVNDFLNFIPPMRPLNIPVNKVGSQSRNLPQLLDQTFHSDNQVLVFPAGICSRRIDGKIVDLPWTKTFITKSISSGRKIVPIHFIGQNSAFFYFIANLSKALKLKFNLAMVFLPSELIKASGKKFKIIIGEPIDIETFDDSKSAIQWAAQVRDKVYSL